MARYIHFQSVSFFNFAFLCVLKTLSSPYRMLGDCGEGVYIEAPFYANFGGHNCHFGNMVYANYHLTCVDDTHIYIGDYTMIGPNVTIATAGHPILPELREQVYQYNMPVHIGRNCWIGAGVIILPGITNSNLLTRACFKNVSVSSITQFMGDLRQMKDISRTIT